MSVTLKSGEKIAALKQGIEGVTGETYADLTEAVNGLKEKQLEAGKDSERMLVWDAIQSRGARTDYSYAFALTKWRQDSFRPMYDIRPTTATRMFRAMSDAGVLDLAKACEDCGVVLDFSNCTSFTNIFESCTSIYRVGTMDIRKGTSFTQAFAWSYMKTIDKLIVDENTPLHAIFNSCTTLENITFEGVIGKNINLQWTAKLTDDSVQSIIDHLKDLTGGTAQTLTLHSTVGGKLTAEQKTDISAKNWTLALI